jgi:hypothetical protein
MDRGLDLQPPVAKEFPSATLRRTSPGVHYGTVRKKLIGTSIVHCNRLPLSDDLEGGTRAAAKEETQQAEAQRLGESPHACATLAWKALGSLIERTVRSERNLTTRAVESEHHRVLLLVSVRD